MTQPGPARNVIISSNRTIGLNAFSLLLSLLVITGCSESPPPEVAPGPTSNTASPLFTLLSPQESGIQFQNDLTEDANLNILSYPYMYNGGGVAVGDLNNDGLPDLYFTANMRPNALYLNEGDLKFRDIAREAGVGGIRGWTTGVTMADVNADGWLDIYVCRSGNVPPEIRSNALFINNGDLTFTDKAAEYGLNDPGYSTQACFFDYDRDGDLDLFLVNHSIKATQGFYVGEMKNRRDPLAGDKLYRNDNGKFTEVGEQAGIISNPIGYGLGVAVSDVNSDGWPDIYVCNDYFEQDYLYINLGNGTFSNQLDSRMAHCSHFSMGVDAADYNNDGHTDIFTLDMLPEDNKRQKLLKGPSNYDRYQMQVKAGYHHQCMRNNLQLNRGNGVFSEVGQLAGVSNTDWSWAPLIADFDNDGRKDLYVTNGYLRDYTNMDFIKYAFQEERDKALKAGQKPKAVDIISRIPSTRIVNYAYRNVGDLQFENAGTSWGITQPSMSNGATYADLDRDGDLDLVVNNINQPAFLYRNDGTEAGNASLAIELKGRGQNTNGIGARIRVEGPDGLISEQELFTTRGYQSAVEPRIHVGVGTAEGPFEVKVIWPNLEFQKMDNVSAGQTLQFNQEEAAATFEWTSQRPRNPVFSGGIRRDLYYQHKEDPFIDFKRDPLLPHVLSTQGPKLASGDLNGDGLTDVVIGGAAGQPAVVYLQNKAGYFAKPRQPDLGKDAGFEDVGLELFDVDGDGDLDLYTVSGGTHHMAGSTELSDRLYLNNGKGQFSRAQNALPNNAQSGSCAVAADYDGDGDLDLFVGTRVTPGSYPNSGPGRLLQNQGGTFTDVTSEKAPALLTAGLVTDAIWADLNGDQQPELAVVGEWGSVRVYQFQDGTLIPMTGNGLEKTSGWWNCLEAIDVDNDGDLDLVGGNLGWNAQMRASPDQPATIDAADFDDNGQMDPILSYYIQGKSYPVPTRDELLDQMNYLKRKFLRYADYAEASISDIIEPEKLKQALHLEAHTLSSSVFVNDGKGNFTTMELPAEAQVSPVFGILSGDYNGDGRTDLLLGGNFYGPRAETGRYDASEGCLLIGKGDGSFEAVPNRESGLEITGNVRDLVEIDYLNGTRMVFIAVSNGPMTTLRWTPKPDS